jgi:hypothetical protein
MNGCLPVMTSQHLKGYSVPLMLKIRMIVIVNARLCVEHKKMAEHIKLLERKLDESDEEFANLFQQNRKTKRALEILTERLTQI